MNPSTALFASRRMCGIAHTMVYSDSKCSITIIWVHVLHEADQVSYDVAEHIWRWNYLTFLLPLLLMSRGNILLVLSFLRAGLLVLNVFRNGASTKIVLFAKKKYKKLS